MVLMMTDPVSIISLTSALLFTCTSLAKKLYRVLETYKEAEHSIDALGSECSVYGATLARLHHYAQKEPRKFRARMIANDNVKNALESLLESSRKTLDLLDREIEKLDPEAAHQQETTTWNRIQAVWNENTMKGLLDRLRGHQIAVSGLIGVLQLETLENIHGMVYLQHRFLRTLFSKISRKGYPSSHSNASDTMMLPSGFSLASNDWTLDPSLPSSPHNSSPSIQSVQRPVKSQPLTVVAEHAGQRPPIRNTSLSIRMAPTGTSLRPQFKQSWKKVDLSGLPSTWYPDLKFSGDGRWFAAASFLTIDLWSISDGAKPMFEKPDLMIHGSSTGHRIWTISPNGKQILFTENNIFFLYDIATRKEIYRECIEDPHTKPLYTPRIERAKFSPDSTMVAMNLYTDTRAAYLWSAEKGLQHLQHAFGTYDLEFSPDSCLLASRNLFGGIDFWNIQASSIQWSRKREIPITLRNCQEPTNVVFSPDNRLVVTNDENYMEIRDVMSGKLYYRLHGSMISPYSCAFSQNGRLFAYAGRDGVYVDNAVTMEQIVTLTNGSGDVSSLEFAPDSSLLVAGRGDGLKGELIIWETQRWSTVTSMWFTEDPYSGYYFERLSFHPNGNHLLGLRNGSNSKMLSRVW